MKFQFQLVNMDQSGVENSYIKGDLQLHINGHIFFNAPSTNVLELALLLGSWLQNIQNGNICDFEYDWNDNGDEYLFHFDVHQRGIQVQSPYAQFSVEPLPIETVKRAALNYCIDIQIALLRIGYGQPLVSLLQKLVTKNKWALILFESNHYDEAFSIIEKLAKEKPSVESLNNYSYLLLHEEEDYKHAWDVLQQALPLQPQSDFPYLMLGEIAIYFKRFEEAKTYLQRALQFRESEIAIHNLGIAHYFLAEFEQAALDFSRCAGDSGMTQLYEVVSWLRADQKAKALTLLDAWNEEADDYTGAIEIADVYIELGCFIKAREHFEKEWQQYYVSPYIVSRYAYTLWQLGDKTACEQIVQHAIDKKTEEIVEEEQTEIDEHWSVQDKSDRLLEHHVELKELQSLIERLEQEFIPPFDFELYPTGGCQLFGCPLHGHPEYEELVK